MQNTTQLRKGRIIDPRFFVQLKGFMEKRYYIHQLEELIKWIHSDDIMEQHHGVIGLRTIQETSMNQQIVSSNVVITLIHHLTQSEFPQLMLESAWIIANLAAGSHEDCEHLVNANIIPAIAALLPSADILVLEHIVRCITNLTVDGLKNCEIILSHNIPDLIINSLKKHIHNQDYVHICASCLSSICRTKPAMKTSRILKPIATLCGLIAYSKIINFEELLESYNAIATHSKSQSVQEIIRRSGVLPLMLQSIVKTDHQTALDFPCLRVFGDICTGTTEQVQQIIVMGFLDVAQNLIASSNHLMRREICWILSNICAEQQSIFIFITHLNLIDHLLLLLTCDRQGIKMEIAFAINNLLRMANTADLAAVFNIFQKRGTLELLVDQLGNNCLEAVQRFLQCLDAYLTVGRRLNQNVIASEYMRLRIEKLFYLSNGEVANLAVRINNQYFGGTRLYFEEQIEEEDDENSDYESEEDIYIE